MSETIDALKEDEKTKLDETLNTSSDDASSHNQEHRSRHHQQNQGDNNWLAGVILIVLGGVFLLSNLTNFHLDNWWALFILIPAFGSLGSAWQAYQKNGRFGESVRGPLIGGFILFFVASVFLFGWNWGTIWPVFLIIGGIGALLNGIFG